MINNIDNTYIIRYYLLLYNQLYYYLLHTNTNIINILPKVYSEYKNKHYSKVFMDEFKYTYLFYF